ncbi:hypothetical protein [Serratia fonticola]|nr:Uncharacterised protein [Serratia fonticola]
MPLTLTLSHRESQFEEKHYGPASEVVPRFVHKFLMGKVERADKP